MIALIQVVQGPNAGRKIQLRGGQRATIGRSERADYAISDDHSLSEVHFEVDCRGRVCQLISQPRSETFANGEAVQRCELRSGDTIMAGASTFSVQLSGFTQTEPEAETSVDEIATVAAAAPLAVVEVYDYLELDPGSRQLAEESADVEVLIDQLLEDEQYEPALILRAHSLGNRHAVWWALHCVRDDALSLSWTVKEKVALEAADAWVRSPSEETRRAAESAADAANYEGAAGLTAYAAFVSEGNIGHPDYDPVLADPRLCGKILAAALIVAAYQHPTIVHRVFSDFLAVGKRPMKDPFVLPS